MNQTSPPALTAIGARLRIARKEHELSLASVAERASISAATLSRIENGKQPLGLELFLLLSSVLEISPDEVLAPDDGDVPAETERRKSDRRRSRPLSKRLDELVQQVELLRRKILAFREDLAPPPA
jgi:transcriptional regulator with XRE-family HTH domain